MSNRQTTGAGTGGRRTSRNESGASATDFDWPPTPSNSAPASAAASEAENEVDTDDAGDLQTRRTTTASHGSGSSRPPRGPQRRRKKFKYNGCLKVPSGELHPAIINAVCQLDDVVTNASIKCTVRQANVQQRTDRRLRIHAPNQIILKNIGQKNMPPLTEVRVVHTSVEVVANLWLPLKLLAKVRQPFYGSSFRHCVLSLGCGNFSPAQCTL